MSIVNYNHEIHDLIAKLKSDSVPKFTIIICRESASSRLAQLDKLTVDFFTEANLADEIFYYGKELIFAPESAIAILSNHNFNLMSIIAGHLAANRAVIYIGRQRGLVQQDNHAFLNLAKNLPTDRILFLANPIVNPVYQQIANQAAIDTIIDADLLVVPANESNRHFIAHVIALSKSINSTNASYVATIAMSLAAKTVPVIAKIDSQVASSIIDLDRLTGQSAYVATFREIISAHPNTSAIDYLQNYVFYPMLDIDAEPIAATNNYPKYINTSGYTYAETSVAWNRLYARFGTGSNSGLYLRRDSTNATVTIPKILHLILSDNGISYAKQHAQILREPWQLHLWNSVRIANELASTRWYRFFNTPVSQLAIRFAILEKYGGFVMGADVEPIKIVSNKLLANKFVTFFVDEAVGLGLELDIIGSVPDIDSITDTIDIDPARKPFEAINNSFLRKPRTSHNLTNRQFDRLHNLFVANSPDNISAQLQQHLLNQTDADIMIYPSYYLGLMPVTQLNRFAFCRKPTVALTRPVIVRESNSQPVRNYLVTHRAMEIKLNENPADRLRSTLPPKRLHS